MAAQKGVDSFQQLSLEEFGAAVCAAVKHFKLDGEPVLVIATVQFVRLIDRNLGVLVTMDQEERWILGVHVEDRAGKFGAFGVVFWLGPQQQLQCGNSNSQTVRRGLVEDRHEVGGAEEVDDGGHV